MLKQVLKLASPLIRHGPLSNVQNQAKLLSTSSQLCEMRRYVPGKFYLIQGFAWSWYLSQTCNIQAESNQTKCKQTQLVGCKFD